MIHWKHSVSFLYVRKEVEEEWGVSFLILGTRDQRRDFLSRISARAGCWSHTFSISFSLRLRWRMEALGRGDQRRKGFTVRLLLRLLYPSLLQSEASRARTVNGLPFNLPTPVSGDLCLVCRVWREICLRSDKMPSSSSSSSSHFPSFSLPKREKEGKKSVGALYRRGFLPRANASTLLFFSPLFRVCVRVYLSVFLVVLCARRRKD